MFIKISDKEYEFNCGDETLTIAGQKFTGIVVLKVYSSEYIFLESKNNSGRNVNVYLAKIKEAQYLDIMLKTFVNQFNKEIQDQYDVGGSKFIKCQETITKLLE